MAVELATAYVTLTVSAKGIAADIERQVVPAAGAAGSKAGGAIASGMKTALAGAAVVGFMRGAFSEMEEAQKVAGQTAAVIRSTGGAAGLSADGFEERASAISKNVGLDDELIQSSENLLATFTAIQNTATDKVFDRATVAAVDLGAAMKMGPEAAAMQLGKALNEPVSGMNKLARSGVQLSAAQQQQVRDFAAVGDIAAAQGVILGEVERQVGGSAAAQATSADHLRVSFGNLQESVGNGLAPALTGLANVGTRVFDVFSGLPTPIQQGILLAGTGAVVWSRYGESIASAGSRAVTFGTDLATPRSAVQGLAGDMNVAAKSSAGLNRGLLALRGLSFAGAIVGVGILTDRLADNKRQADDWASSLVEGKGPVEALRTLRAATDEASSEAGKGSLNGFNPDDSSLFVTWSNSAREAADRAKAANSAWSESTTELLKVGSAADIASAAADGLLKDVPFWQARAAAIRANADAGAELAQSRIADVAQQIADDATLRGSLDQLKSSIEAAAANERDAAGTGAEAAEIRADSARNQVANAKAVEQAEQNLVSVGRAVEQAQRGVADAYRARDAAVRGVAQAEQGVLDAERGREGAVRNLATANATLEASQRQSVQLARDLSGAFDAARESLDDLNRSAAGDQLSVTAARFALTDARIAKEQGPDDPGAANAQGKLDLAYQQAQLAYAAAVDRASESAENLNERQAAGLAQSPEVLAAQEAVATNATTIATNQQAVADAHVAVEASDRNLAEAHQRVADAQVAVRAADQAIIDAKDQVVQARRDQQTAAEDLATAEKTAADEIVVADFLVWLSKDAAQRKSVELKDQAVEDFGLMLTAADNYGLGLAGVNAWLTTLTQGLDPTSPLRQNIDSLLAQLTPIAIPAAPSGGAGSGIGLGAGASGSLNGGGQPIYGPTGGIVGYRPASVSVRSGDGKSVTVQGDLVINAEKADADQLAERFAARVLDRVR